MSQAKKESEMSFWEHLDVLRGVLIKIAVVVLLVAVGLFVAMPWLFDNVILAPCKGDFVLYRFFAYVTRHASFLPQFVTGDFHVELINIELASQFFIHVSTSFWMALVLCFPIVIYLFWSFVSPGLYENEKRGARRSFVFGNLMFFLGVAVGYFIVFPITLRFLANYHVSEMVPNQISLSSYIDTFLMLILVMGLIFELPLVAWLLGRIGLLKRDFFKRYRRHAIVILLIIAAVITPTGDPFTLMVVFLPIYLLYELSALLVKPTATEPAPLEE